MSEEIQKSQEEIIQDLTTKPLAADHEEKFLFKISTFRSAVKAIAHGAKNYNSEELGKVAYRVRLWNYHNCANKLCKRFGINISESEVATREVFARTERCVLYYDM